MKKIIALALLLICLVMFFLPWMNLTVGIQGEQYSAVELIDWYNTNYAGYFGTTYSYNQLIAELRREFLDLQQEAASRGISIDGGRLTDSVEALCDGGITPIDLLRVTGSGKMLAGGMKTAYEKLGDPNGFDVYQRYEYDLYSYFASVFSTANIVLWILYVLALACLGLAVYAVLAGKKYLTIPLLGVLLIMEIGVIVCVTQASAAVSQVMAAMGEDFNGIYEFFGQMGVSVDLSLLHVAIPGIVAVIAAAGVVAVAVFMKDEASTGGIRVGGRSSGAGRSAGGGRSSGGPAVVSAGKWTCTNCGAVLPGSSGFCPTCGSKRPEPPRCPSCRSLVREGEAFCTNCGASLRAAPKPETPRASACGNCGNVLIPGQAFCPVCGAAVGGNPPQPAYTPPQPAYTPPQPEPTPIRYSSFRKASPPEPTTPATQTDPMTGSGKWSVPDDSDL